MDFGQKDTRERRSRNKTKVGEINYPHSLQFYSLPPTENITLQEFETFAIDRLKGEKAALPQKQYLLKSF